MAFAEERDASAADSYHRNQGGCTEAGGRVSAWRKCGELDKPFGAENTSVWLSTGRLVLYGSTQEIPRSYKSTGPCAYSLPLLHS